MENFLMEKHAEQYTGLDDEMSDDFVNWMEQLDVQEVIEYADEYLKELIGKIKVKKEEVRKATGAFKYDFAYDEIINLIKK